jgi:hypothetical protein
MARIYGVFTVQMQDVVPVHILLMSNAAKCGKYVYKTFDLKGSIVNREVKPNEMLTTSCLKDVNLLNLCKDEFILGFQYKDRKTVMEQIYKDIKFLSRHNIMDYSLLVIIETNADWVE